MTAVAEAPEKRQPANADTDPDTGSRWYIHPLTQERFVSVTTALKVIAKEALIFWAAKVVAEEAMAQLPRLVAASRRTPCEQTGQHRCGTCRACAVTDLRGRPAAVRDEAANLGSRLHHAAEMHELTGALPDDPEIAPFFEQYLAWRKQFKPTFEAAEMTVISRQYGYAGTLDGLVRYGWLPPKHKDLLGLVLPQDTKTGKGVYAETALQLAAYRNADAILLPDGTELPLPELAETGIVLHVRPDNYQVHPVPVGQREHGAFLTALALYRWQAEHGPDAIGRAMYKPSDTAAEKPAPAARATKPQRTAPAQPAKTTRPVPARSDATREHLRSFAQIRDDFAAGAAHQGARLSDDSIPF